MRIKQVEYREARLISTAQFENARVEFGVVIEVGDEGPQEIDAAIEFAKQFVKDQLLERIIEITAKEHAWKEEAARSRVSKKYGL